MEELERVARDSADAVARGLAAAADAARTEADFRREAARLVEEVATVAGLVLQLRDEYSLARGRADSVYNRLIVEYKRPGVIKESNSRNAAVIQQVQNYIEDVAHRERRDSARLAGVALDGRFFIFVRQVGEGWAVDDPVQVNAASVELFLRTLFSLASGAALIPENLVQDFGPQNFRARRAVQAFHRAHHTTRHPLVGRLFEQWQVFFSEATDYSEWSEKIAAKAEFQNLVRGIGLDPRYADAARVFFSLHTYYALLIKLIAWLAAARFSGQSTEPLRQFASKRGDDLKEAFADLEKGGPFGLYGIKNFLEGDFFGWYLAAWNEEIEDALHDMAVRLADYDPGTLEIAPENARDLLKKLYHYLLPRPIRHDLGEYYTPDWLAERLIIQTMGEADLGNPERRVLDPACGSGTFLVLHIRNIKLRMDRHGWDPGATLRNTLENVIGFDLNPLAVIASRTNYLLALGDLLQHRTGDISLPVYQADSVLTPTQGGDPQQANIFQGDVYPLRTSVGTFHVPAHFVERAKMESLTTALDEAVEGNVGEDGFLAMLSGKPAVHPEDIESGQDRLRTLYRELQDLHDQELNGVWARIIKNGFAPVFLMSDPCHFVVGNPPWVNWEHLPDDYRQMTIPLWQYYGLFQQTGMDTILGGGKKDLSMLMTYVSVHRYLRPGGRLGFVVPQNLFKTSGAGQGFRRFQLPDRTSFGPLIVEDMVDLNPFEGAANRTATAVWVRGHALQYPVSYRVWRRRNRGQSLGFDTPYEEVFKDLVRSSDWQAEPINENDPTSAWLTARPAALLPLRRIVGNSPYVAREGCNTGGANAVYWVEVIGRRPGGLVVVSNITEGARRVVARTQAAVEPDLLFPLLRGRDVRRWLATPSASILMMQDPETRRGIGAPTVANRYPRALAYLQRFEDELRARAAFRRYFRDSDSFWSMFNVGQYTFADWKVVWREQSTEFQAAVVGPAEGMAVIPDHKLMMVACDSEDEACYLCGMLQCSPARLVVQSYTLSTSVSTHVLDNVAVPRFQPANQAHRQVAEAVQRCRVAATANDVVALGRAEADLDLSAADVWAIPQDAVDAIQATLEEVQ